MKEPVVVDSTCLVGLDKIGRLELLPNLFEPILAPPEVERALRSECNRLGLAGIEHDK